MTFVKACIACGADNECVENKPLRSMVEAYARTDRRLQLDAKRARKSGLVDDTCHPTDLAQAALRWAGQRKEEKKSPGIARRATDFLARSPLADRLIFDKARSQTLAKTGGHYPAPLLAIDVVHDGLKLPLRRALDIETGAFSELVVSETAKSLI